MNNKQNKLQWASRAVALLSLALLVCAGSAVAQLPIPASTQFDITGFIQEATLDPACAAVATCGGTIKVNGHLVTVPKNLILVLPANQLTWQELFAYAPPPYGIPGKAGVTTAVPTTGLALSDCAPALAGGVCTPGTLGSLSPLTTYEAQVVGNRVIAAGPPATDQYIAALINISQHALNSGAGFINFMDPLSGEMRVGGLIGSATTGTRVRLNDPLGRYSKKTLITTTDRRFTVDPDNPTITAGTGFPMCVPPNVVAGIDQCPAGNRPFDLLGNPATVIQMNNPVTLPGVFPDPKLQAPFKVGDYITFAGTLVRDTNVAGATPNPACPVTSLSPYPTVGPWPTALLPATGTDCTYISAHTITNNVAIFTWPGTDPAYVKTDVMLIGTGGLTILGGAEAAIRTRFEGMTTDPSRAIQLFGMDLSVAGAVTERDWGLIGVDQGPPTGAVKGRWRFRPPCTATSTTFTDKACSPPPAGTFLPPTREMMARIVGATNPLAANGILAGQYHAPIAEYIFPENIPGTPVVANNFEALDFLFKGGYTSVGDPAGVPPVAGTLVGQLNPWPGVAAVPPPPPVCTPGPCAADVVTVTLAEYRTTKQRLIINATSSTISPAVVLTLQPYLTRLGAIFDPLAAGLGNTFTNNGGGLYIIDIVGAPEPALPPAAPIVVKSNLGGVSAPSPLTRIRL